MCSEPKVSIVIPVYNGANYLREAIDSALAQTYVNLEVVVINDGSSDGGETERIALSYGDRIRYFSKENGGVASALNMGIREMQGEYFSWLSHDDVYYPFKIAEQIAFLHVLGRQVMLYSDYEVIDSSSRIIRTESKKRYAPNEIRRALILDNPIQGCSALVPKDCFDKVGYFDERLKTTQDYDMWFRIANCFDVVFMPISLIKSREHPEQGTITMTSLHFRECNDFLIYGMISVVKEFKEKYSTDMNRLFLGECIKSFTSRGFHRASRIALLQYIKLLLQGGSIPKIDAIKLIIKFAVVNICRLKNIFRVCTHNLQSLRNNGNANAK